MNTLQGYVTSRSFNGFSLPVPIQNKLLRAHAKEENMVYLLPQCELFIEDNYMSLFETSNNIEEKAHLGMCSIHMMPQENKKFLDLTSTLIKKEVTLHFIFEDIIINPEVLPRLNEDRNINQMINENQDLLNLELDI